MYTGGADITSSLFCDKTPSYHHLLNSINQHTPSHSILLLRTSLPTQPTKTCAHTPLIKASPTCSHNRHFPSPNFYPSLPFFYSYNHYLLFPFSLSPYPQPSLPAIFFPTATHMAHSSICLALPLPSARAAFSLPPRAWPACGGLLLPHTHHMQAAFITMPATATARLYTPFHAHAFTTYPHPPLLLPPLHCTPAFYLYHHHHPTPHTRFPAHCLPPPSLLPPAIFLWVDSCHLRYAGTFCLLLYMV